MLEIVTSRIIDDAREKIADTIVKYRYRDETSAFIADQILALSGTTDIECPECKGVPCVSGVGKKKKEGE